MFEWLRQRTKDKDDEITRLKEDVEYYRRKIQYMEEEQKQRRKKSGELFEVKQEFHEFCDGCCEIELTMRGPDHIHWADGNKYVCKDCTLTCKRYDRCARIQERIEKHTEEHTPRSK